MTTEARHVTTGSSWIRRCGTYPARARVLEVIEANHSVVVYMTGEDMRGMAPIDSFLSLYRPETIDSLSV